MIKSTQITSKLKLTLFSFMAAMGLSLAAITPASAHLGSSVACGVPPWTSTSIKSSSWGCGQAGRDTANHARILVNVGDRVHDHSCVYTYVQTTTASWHNVGVTSCTEGGQTGNIWVNESSTITGARIYRFSPYGNNYLTLQTW